MRFVRPIINGDQVCYRFLCGDYRISVNGTSDLVTEELLSRLSVSPITQEAIDDRS